LALDSFNHIISSKNQQKRKNSTYTGLCFIKSFLLLLKTLEILLAAGVFCAIVSHPADTIVSKLNQAAGGNFVDAAKSLGLMG